MCVECLHQGHIYEKTDEIFYGDLLFSNPNLLFTHLTCAVFLKILFYGNMFSLKNKRGCKNTQPNCNFLLCICKQNHIFFVTFLHLHLHHGKVIQLCILLDGNVFYRVNFLFLINYRYKLLF